MSFSPSLRRCAAGWPLLPALFHFGRLAAWFKDLDLSSPFPPLNLDYAQYYSRAVRVHEFFTASGRFWGYDPFMMAGSISGALEPGSLWTSLTAHALLPLVPLGKTILFLEILGLGALPFLFYWSARRWGLDKPAAWTAFTLDVLLLYSFEPLTRYVYRAGLFGFFVASHAAPGVVGLFHSWLEGKSLKTLGWFTLSASLCLFIHSALLIPLATACGFLILFHRRTLSIRAGALMACSAGLVFFSNAFWLFPMLQFMDHVTTLQGVQEKGFYWLLNFFSLIQPTWLNSISALLHVGLALGAGAVFWKNRGKTAARAGMGTLGFLFFIVVFGDVLPVLENWQTTRYFLLVWLGVYLSLAGALSASFQRDRRFAAAIAAGALFFAFIAAAQSWSHRFINRLNPAEHDLVGFLKERTGNDHRILFENSLMTEKNLGSLLPLLTGRIFAGGPAWANFLDERFLDFRHGFRVRDRLNLIYHLEWAGLDLTEASPNEFKKRLDLYNIGWIVSASALASQSFRAHADLFGPVERIGYFEIRPVRDPAGWFLEGSGDVEFGYDQIRISNASKGKIILKNHWSPILSSNAPLSAAPALPNPKPFLVIDNSAGQSEIIISGRGDR